ncbi:MAG: DUF4190 domain-containing protein [Planctomycetes bacterium]|nr:DUF4190 domain-containing protein [Planctomycetota bacterium]MCP4838812.1 DUF4190 domain-containing protein [Planctomycetota bacterium]
MMSTLRPENPLPPDQNGLGTAAFVISIIGLFSAGILSIVGLIMGAIAMKREPKGLAIAGFVIGIVGIFWGCLLIGLYAAFVGALGVGIGFAILSAVYSQIEDGVQAVDAASAVITEWRDTHGDVLPDEQMANEIFQAAGINATYQLIDPDEFIITLVIDPDSGDPWTFTGAFEADGDRLRFNWKSDDRSSQGHFRGF